MTKKQFELIAAIIAFMPTHAPSLRAAKSSCANSFADRLAYEFPRFNRATFLKACGE